jgi:hypothetical protein
MSEATARQASRRTRRARLRCTAPPTRRPATKAAASPSGLGRTYSTTRLPAARRPSSSAPRTLLLGRAPRRRACAVTPRGWLAHSRRAPRARQAESRLRPLDRRRARMARPARVRMRTRNPCRFFLLHGFTCR